MDLGFLGVGRKRQNGNAKMKISNRSRKSFLDPNFVRAGASPIKIGERRKLESFEGMVKRAKL